MAYYAGNGLKRPLNMLEMPIYPDIKAAGPYFRDAGKFNQLDVGKVVLDQDVNTQLVEDAILLRSYRENIDKYGQSSHQEKITVFRPPLQSYYEDFGPLNRLPTKINAIVPRINPSTVTDNGTSAFKVNNMSLPELDKHISDKIQSNSWFSTYYNPIDLPPDNVILPDFETKYPSTSVYSGIVSQILHDAPIPDKILTTKLTPTSIVSGINTIKIDSDDQRSNMKLKNTIPTVSTHAGTKINIEQLTADQSPGSIQVGLYDTMPVYSVHSGYKHTRIDGETQNKNLTLFNTLPQTSTHSGISPITVDGKTNQNIHLVDKLPISPIYSGQNNAILLDSEYHIPDMNLVEQFTPLLAVTNPSSEDGYKDKRDYYNSPQNSIKLRENPKVPVIAHADVHYKEDKNIKSNQPHFKSKIEPVKVYGSSLNRGTILKSGIDGFKPDSRYFTGSRKNSLILPR